MTRALLLIVLFTFAANSVFAQANYTLKGVVTDGWENPLEDAIVYVQETKQTYFTNAKGRFAINALKPGNYTISVHRIGYVEIQRTIAVLKNTAIKVMIQADDQTLDQVVIKGHKEEILNAQAVTTLNELALRKSAGLTLGETLNEINGVNMLQTGSSIAKPVIHGMHSNRVLIMNNGVRQEGQQWGLEHAPGIDPYLAQEITVIKGAAGVQYGSDAIAGVVMVNPAPLPHDNEPDEQGIHGRADLAGMSNGRQGSGNIQLEGQIKAVEGLAWRVQASGKKAGNIQTPDYYLDNTGVEELNFSAATGYKARLWEAQIHFSRFYTKLGLFSGSHTGNLTDLETAINSEVPLRANEFTFSYDIDRPFQSVAHNMLTVKTKWQVGNLGKLHATFGYQLNHRKEYDLVRRRIAQGNQPQLDFELKTTTADVHLDHKFGTHWRGTVGLSGMKQSNVYEGRRLIPNFRSYTGGLYAIEHFIKDRYELEAGIRYEAKFIETFRNEDGEVIQEDFNFNNISIALGGMYRINEDLNIKMNVSSAWRAPNISELFSDGVHQGTASYELGDKTLEPETAYNTSVDVNYNKKRFTAQVTLYHKIIDNFIYLEPQFPETILTIRGAFPLFEYKQVNATFTGTDIAFGWQLVPGLRWQNKASIVRARNQTDDEYLVLIPADRFESSLTWSLPATNRLNDNYLTIANTYVAQQTRFPENIDFADPPAAYNLVDVRLGTTLNQNRNPLNVSVEVKNIFNVGYRDYLNRFRYFSDEIGRNFIVRFNYTF